MGKYDALLLRILRGTADGTVRFDELRHLLRRLGFEEAVRGGNFLFIHERMEGILNFQPNGQQAKPYQVRQVRDVIVRDKLTGGSDGE